MSIFNMIAQGSGGGWWGNIWEPLNLTVTKNWLDATIKWEDNEIWTIPPTTFQKSELVRKIGSAPTSPSDWDLVVTETVKDTYKVSGYVDQWLTDRETYYYRVFSYSDLGGISYCDAVSVTISQWWQPWVNTVLYIPIDSSDTSSVVYDHSTNSNDFSWYGTADYDTLTSWKRVINLNWSNWIYIDTALITAQPVTISLWVYRDWNQNNDGNVFANQQDIWWMCMAWFNSSELASFYDQNGSLVWFNNKYSTSDQTWYNIAVTFDSNTLTMYVNWVQFTQNSWNNCDFSSVDATSFWFTRHAWGVSYNRRYMTWKMWDMIVEDKVRTSQEVADYFDQTKWDYWIS